MNRIAIDRLELGLGVLPAAQAEAVKAALPDALQRHLDRRLATAGLAGRVLQLATADLGRLELPARTDAHGAAEAIALRLSDWIATQLAPQEP